MTQTRQELFARSQALTERLVVGDPLVQASRLFYGEVIDRLRARGYPEVRLSHTALLQALDREHGSRATEIAERMEITKQAVGQQIADVEALGWVERVPDPSDGRAKIVRITAAGFAVVVAGLEVFAELEGELRERLGDELFAALGESTRAAQHALEEITDA